MRRAESLLACCSYRPHTMKKHLQRNRLPQSYKKRTYRGAAEKSGLCSTYVRIRETDLHILSETDVSREARELAAKFRLQVERHIDAFPEFGTSLVPLPDDILAPPIIRAMLAAGIDGLGRADGGGGRCCCRVCLQRVD
jgi:hypothetical protein